VSLRLTLVTASARLGLLGSVVLRFTSSSSYRVRGRVGTSDCCGGILSLPGIKRGLQADAARKAKEPIYDQSANDAMGKRASFFWKNLWQR
jgi:hypothetical protein